MDASCKETEEGKVNCSLHRKGFCEGLLYGPYSCFSWSSLAREGYVFNGPDMVGLTIPDGWSEWDKIKPSQGPSLVLFMMIDIWDQVGPISRPILWIRCPSTQQPCLHNNNHTQKITCTKIWNQEKGSTIYRGILFPNAKHTCYQSMPFYFSLSLSLSLSLSPLPINGVDGVSFLFFKHVKVKYIKIENVIYI